MVTERGEILDRSDKGGAHRGHQRGRGKRVPAVVAEEADHAALILQAGHVQVEGHPVDALDLQGDMLGEDLGH